MRRYSDITNQQGGRNRQGGRGRFGDDDRRGGRGRNDGGRSRGEPGRGNGPRGRGRGDGDARGGPGGRGRGRGDGGRGRGRGRGPNLSGLQSVLSNIVLADVTEGFQFFLYSVDCQDGKGQQIDSRHRRRYLFDLGLWDGLLKDMPAKEKDDLKRVVFFSSSLFFSGRQIPGLEPAMLPMTLPVGDRAGGDSIQIVKLEAYIAPTELTTRTQHIRSDQVAFDNRCADCTKAFPDVGSLLQHCQQTRHKPVIIPEGKSDNAARPASPAVFISYVNQVLQRALGERLARWGSEFIDPTNMTEPKDRNGESLGVRVFEAYCCTFGLLRKPEGPATLSLTVDLRAKVMRTKSVLDQLCQGQNPGNYKPMPREQNKAKNEWISQVVISMHDKRSYSVVDLDFGHSPVTLPVEGLGMSHAEYFAKRKGFQLKYPNAVPMVVVLGRNNKPIFLPPELIAGNDLGPQVKQRLPMIASFAPEARNRAIEKIRAYLVPGKQRSRNGGLLPALGIQLRDERLGAKARVLPLPRMLAAAIEIPQDRASNWSPTLNSANFRVSPTNANTLQIILVCHEKIASSANQVYKRIRDLVNGMNSSFRLGGDPVEFIKAGDNEKHWGPIERCLSSPSGSRKNIFVLDFTKPRGALDPAYPVIKQMLSSHGFLSQFVNFKTYAHDQPRDEKKSTQILQGVARQILQKTGIRLWWVHVPRSLPTPSVFVGVDVFHAPRIYDPKEKRRVAKGSCAAIIVQIKRGNSGSSNQIELFSQTFAREPGKEYDLGDALKTTIASALRELNVSPQSCIVWRDGIGESNMDREAIEEISGIRAGLRGNKPVGFSERKEIPLSYVVCQKRIDTKLLAKGISGEPDGKYAAPSGTLVQGIEGLQHDTFYINGTAPPYSTPKPVRFIVVQKDKGLEKVSLPELSWDLCHDYPNWTGPIKVPSVVQMAHKLAELGGCFKDCGRTIDGTKFKNKIHFL